LIDRTVEKFGKNIDYLYLCAGVGLDQMFEEAKDLTNYRSIMEINYFGAISCTQHALPYLKNAHGHICVISSLQGKFAIAERTGYSASKHAVNGFFHSLRAEMSGKIYVTVICPGYVWTEFQNSKLSTGDETQVVRDRSKYMSVEQCVKETIDAVRYKEAEYVMTLKGKAGVVLQSLLPRFLVDKIATATRKAAHQKVKE
jgi:short-subunit dehydrogenase